jgi:SAM-dependent methyltransferase
MALSDEEVKRRLAIQRWTAHNIRLSREVTTMPGNPDFIDTDLRLHAILRSLSFIYGDNLGGVRVADLGCLEGGFTLALAQRGMNVTGIEARQQNLEKAQLLKEQFDLSNVEFIRDDVKNFTREKYGSFDVILALGILYHLDQPVAWLRQLAEATRSVLIIDSHFAPADDTALELLDPALKHLGQMEIFEESGLTYEGRAFFEYGPEVDREGQLWASYSNGSSFWLTKESLLRAVMESGFPLVVEQHDYSADSFNYHSVTRARGMYLALKSGVVAKDLVQRQVAANETSAKV